ncbi:cupin domain-containing protein [Cupriavidus sp. P-10]|uniref:cupin domain-containing protein n=1 Tax=Cupriavidus sp. P-10 TaxID=2027911 RepID=UPI000EBEEFC8|nr:cupin domain-containing protein [Cupriavidus sp. P-10]BDB27035.1 cupin domain-containing protein [Cupriavidus sp. P-10]
MLHFTNAAREFVETGFPGIRVATIWAENGEGADFIEFKAGARFPLHDHEGPEQILVLSGRIRFGDLVLSAGDFMKIGNGEQHDAEALEDSVFFLAHVGGAIIQE